MTVHIVLTFIHTIPFMDNRTGQFGFFDYEQQLDKIYQINDFLPNRNVLMLGFQTV